MAMFALYPLYLLLSGGSVLATPEVTEDAQGASLLWCTSNAKLLQLAVK